MAAAIRNRGTNRVGTTHAHVGDFRVGHAWFCIVLLTIGNVISRGLAKSGSREHDNGS